MDSRKTTEEIEALKASWREDPCFDLEDAEGFEAHREELAAWRRGVEDEQVSARLAKLEVAVRPAVEALVIASSSTFPMPAAPAVRALASLLLPVVERLDRQAADIERMQDLVERALDEIHTLKRGLEP